MRRLCWFKISSEAHSRYAKANIISATVNYASRSCWFVKVPLVQPHRRLVHEGSLMLYRYVKRNKKIKSSLVLKEVVMDKKFLFYLFSDLLIQCKRHSSDTSLELVRVMRLSSRLEPASIVSTDQFNSPPPVSPTDDHSIPIINEQTQANQLRIVDDDIILYLMSCSHAQSHQLDIWMKSINCR